MVFKCWVFFFFSPTFFLQISDRGGGVPLRKIDRLFNYMYSTAPTPSLEPGAVPLVHPFIKSNLIIIDLVDHCLSYMTHTHTHIWERESAVFLICSCAGWFWLWLAHFQALCPILPGGFKTLLHGGRWHRCCHLFEGKVKKSSEWNGIMTFLSPKYYYKLMMSSLTFLPGVKLEEQWHLHRRPRRELV